MSQELMQDRRETEHESTALVTGFNSKNSHKASAIQNNLPPRNLKFKALGREF